MRCYYSDTFVLPLPGGHRFPMAKYAALRQHLADHHVIAQTDFVEAPQAAWADLALVHTPDYLAAVADGTLPRDAQRRIGFPWSPQMVERARRSVGATVDAARTALVEGAAANLAGGTHHAFADRGEGYCVFNDVAVAARVLLRDGLAHRPLVVDCDVHQGNGTAAIFAADPRVFTLSLHGARNYPFRKEKSDMDVEFEDGTEDAAYLDRLAQALEQAVQAHQPDIVFYLAGADPYAGDRLGRLALTIDGLRRRDAHIVTRCRTADLPIVITMSGGYAHDVGDIVTIHANTVRVAVERLAHERTKDARPSTRIG